MTDLETLATHLAHVNAQQRRQAEELAHANATLWGRVERQEACIDVMLQFVRNPSALNQQLAEQAARELRACVSSNSGEQAAAPIEETQLVRAAGGGG